MIPKILESYPKLYEWVKNACDLMNPKSVSVFLDPVLDDEKYTQVLLDSGVMKKLKNPNSYYVATDPEDTARVESCTFICSKTEKEAGITNNWKDPVEMREALQALFKGCMEGREMIVIPYSMGPLDSPHKIIGVEITDSPYVAINMRRMARCGSEALKCLTHQDFIPGIHSVGRPLKGLDKDDLWPCSPKNRVIAHFPESREIFSYGSGYGGNALLGKKCLSLRIASYLGYKNGFLAEHMLIMGIENPKGEKKYILAAFPSACGKTNLAMLESKMPGWKITCVGDDIAWIFIDDEGSWRAINPEFGFFGVAPGTSYESNPVAMRMIQKDTLFTNTGFTEDGEVYWEGMGPLPKNLMTWKNHPYDASEKAAHPNSRFTCPLENCDRLDPDYKNRNGVKIDAIIFGGRRSNASPLVTQSFSYEHGVFMGATLASETTAAAIGDVGKLRNDPFAMLPFCGYNMGWYFRHWLEMGKASKPPKIFQVNWFRKGKDGNYLWPGFSENIRVLQWIFDRLDLKHPGEARPFGIIPRKGELNVEGLNVDQDALFEISDEMQSEEKKLQNEFLEKFKEDLPKEFNQWLS